MLDASTAHRVADGWVYRQGRVGAAVQNLNFMTGAEKLAGLAL